LIALTARRRTTRTRSIAVRDQFLISTRYTRLEHCADVILGGHVAGDCDGW